MGLLLLAVFTLTGAVPAESAPQQPAVSAPSVPETVWLDDDLPPGAAPEGDWIWDSSNFAAGTRSHGHPSEKGVHSHGYNMEQPVTIPPGSMITQQVWLDPKDPPKGISLRFRLSTGEEVGVYWEAEEEVFKPDETQELWYYGPLPELDKWTTLEVLAEDLGLENGQITGVRFTTYDGRVLWDRTVLTAAPPIEEAQDLLEEPVGIRPNPGTK